MAEGELALPREITTRWLPSAAAAHLDNGEAYTRWHIRGHLQWMNEDVRSVQQGGDAAPVVSFALTDDTGPIIVDFCREAATQYLELLRGALEDESNPVIVLENVLLKNPRMRSLVPMKRLYSTGGTSLQVLSAATAPATDARASVHQQRVPCVTDLSKLVSPAPFLCSVRGFVADRGELAQARHGADMRPSISSMPRAST